MTPNPNPNPPPPDRRRPLSFPAVHPSDSVSPATLLPSLLTLSQTILNLNNSSSFPTQRRNARKATRQISLLLVFLQELELRPSLLPNDAVPSLSDIHFAFQKLLFILQDCAREGARLFMLLNSRHVASQFRSVFRAAASALDVLPLQNIEVSWEVRELVELVTKQARKARFELDPEDEAEAERVNSVLRQFERGTDPDLNSMKRTLTYLEINSWIDCNREVKFLEEELLCSKSCASDDDEHVSVSLLSSLNAFMCYGRGVIFEKVDFTSLNNDEKPEVKRGAEALICERLQEDFRCPISLEMMTDPVTTSTGQTYDRASIQKWLKAGNRVCPKTGETLSTTELVPNTTLKRLIQQFCADNGISLAKSSNRSRRGGFSSEEAGSPAAAHAVQFLCWFLARRLMSGTEEQQSKAAFEARQLARSNVFNRTCLIEVGIVPPLIDLLSAAGDRTTQENAMVALLKLSKHSSGQQCIMEVRGLAPILRVLKRGLSFEARQIAAATIFYLCSVKEYRKIIGENPEAISGLVEMIKEGITTTTTQPYPTTRVGLDRSSDAIVCGKKNAVVAVFGLLLLPENHKKVLEAGAVPAIVAVLSSSSSLDKADLLVDCLAVLAALAESTEGACAVLQSDPLHLIIAILQSAASRAAKEHCVSILMSLCANVGSEVVGVLVEDPSLMPLLYSVLTDGTPHAAKKARSLIRVLQEFNEQRVFGLTGSSVSRQPLVHLS